MGVKKKNITDNIWEGDLVLVVDNDKINSNFSLPMMPTLCFNADTSNDWECQFQFLLWVHLCVFVYGLATHDV